MDDINTNSAQLPDAFKEIMVLQSQLNVNRITTDTLQEQTRKLENIVIDLESEIDQINRILIILIITVVAIIICNLYYK